MDGGVKGVNSGIAIVICLDHRHLALICILFAGQGHGPLVAFQDTKPATEHTSADGFHPPAGRLPNESFMWLRSRPSIDATWQGARGHAVASHSNLEIDRYINDHPQSRQH